MSTATPVAPADFEAAIAPPRPADPVARALANKDPLLAVVIEIGQNLHVIEGALGGVQESLINIGRELQAQRGEIKLLRAAVSGLLGKSLGYDVDVPPAVCEALGLPGAGRKLWTPT